MKTSIVYILAFILIIAFSISPALATCGDDDGGGVGGMSGGGGGSGGSGDRISTGRGVVGRRVFEEKEIKKLVRTKLVHEGKYVAEVDVELFETEDEWSPYLSLEQAYKLDDVRAALRRGDVKSAARHGRVFTLTPVAV